MRVAAASFFIISCRCRHLFSPLHDVIFDFHAARLFLMPATSIFTPSLSDRLSLRYFHMLMPATARFEPPSADVAVVSARRFAADTRCHATIAAMALSRHDAIRYAYAC